MVSAIIRDIVDDALTIIGEVAGVGVQQYSEDRMMADCIRSFNLLFKKHRWHQYRKWYQFTLDGTLGIITDADGLSSVLDFEDIISVHRDGEQNPLPILPLTTNPFGTNIVGGTRIRYWTGLAAVDENYDGCKIQIYPKTSTGIINVHAMVYPQPSEPWDWDDVMHLDRDMLAWGTSFMTLASDDLNTNAANMTKAMMEDKYKTIISSFGDQPIAIEGDGGMPTTWREY